MNLLPVKLDDLIHARTVEAFRLEFKKTWNDVIRDGVVRTVCAFANDFQGVNGGYVILGIEETGGKPILPPHGLDTLDLDLVQKKVMESCFQIEPRYQPRVVPEIFMERSILVIWAPRGDTPPNQAPEHGAKGGAPRQYYMRIGPQTVEAKGELLTQLMQHTARVPYDDRRDFDVSLAALSPTLLARFLADIGSDLASRVPLNVPDVLRALKLSGPADGSEVPRNAALLFFTDDPEVHFPGVRVEVLHFGDDAGGDLIEVRAFRGPLPGQIRQTIDYLTGLLGEVIRKVAHQPEAERFVPFPHKALEESIVNAVYHRGYDPLAEPVKVGLYPDRLEITSYPGPVPGLEPKHLAPGARPPLLRARNPRVGDLMKSLKLAETYPTGIAKIHSDMKANGSPPPSFDFDEGRTYFRVTLPAHPGYVVLHALREAAVLWHTGERGRSIERLEEARKGVPGSGAMAAQLIQYAAAMGDIARARRTLLELDQAGATDRRGAYLALARAHLDRGETTEARTLLESLPGGAKISDKMEYASLLKRAGDLEKAHQVFSSVEADIQNDPHALQEFAQTKWKLAAKMLPKDSRDLEVRRLLDRDAGLLLHRVISLTSDQPTRAAWAWFELAQISGSHREAREACEQAMKLEPREPRFREWFEQKFGPPTKSAPP